MTPILCVDPGIAPHSFPRSPRNGPRFFSAYVSCKELTRRWKDDLALAREKHTRRKHAVSTLPDRQFDRIPLGGRACTARQLITGISAHDAYDAGQRQLIKKMIRR